MRCLACGNPNARKIFGLDGDVVCDEKCEKRFLNSMGTVLAMSNQDFEKWMLNDTPFSDLKDFSKKTGLTLITARQRSKK